VTDRGASVVILGIICIVVFGSWSSGLDTDTSVTRLIYVWRRPAELFFFLAAAVAISLLHMFVSTLDATMAARQALSVAPFAGREWNLGVH
jgi:hypothetical protein